jgi:hypothetical protein
VQPAFLKQPAAIILKPDIMQKKVGAVAAILLPGCIGYLTNSVLFHLFVISPVILLLIVTDGKSFFKKAQVAVNSTEVKHSALIMDDYPLTTNEVILIGQKKKEEENVQVYEKSAELNPYNAQCV